MHKENKIYNLTAYLNISLPSFLKEDYLIEQNKTIEQLIELSEKLKVPFNDYGEFVFNIERITKKEAGREDLLKSIENEKIIYIKEPQTFLTSDLLKIAVNSIDVPLHLPKGVRKEWEDFDPFLVNDIVDKQKTDVIEFNKALMYEIFNKRIQDLVFACNLSNFGSLTINEYIIFQDSTVYPIGGKQLDYKVLFEAKRNSLEWQYPSLGEITIEEVWEWLIKRKDFLKGFSDTAVTRALINMLEIPNSDANMKLFRAVMGIEGLYTKGKNNLLEQVREKTQILLGKQENFKKLYSNMYEFRSKFIHGKMNFPATVNIDFSKNVKSHNEDLKRATHFAILLLGASIQQLIIRNWNGIHFDYIVNDIEK